MNDTIILAKDKLGGCRYIVSVAGTTLRCTMRGYGLEAVETQEINRRGKHFNYDADALRAKMVTLERRMRELARLTTVLLKNNDLTGIEKLRSTKSSVRRPARGVNPLTRTKI